MEKSHLILSLKCLYTQSQEEANFIHGYSWSCLYLDYSFSGYIFLDNQRINFYKLIKKREKHRVRLKVVKNLSFEDEIEK